MSIKSYLVDPEQMTITPVEYSGSLESMYELIRCSMVQVAPTHPAVQFWVDEEGLLHDGRKFMFMFDGYSEPLTGRAIAHCIDDEGETIAPEMDMDTAAQMIRFVEPVRLPDQSVCLHDRMTDDLARFPDRMQGETSAVWLSQADYVAKFGGGG